ncbi:ribosomal protein L30, ferredoxin-like fold domain-containing protein [Phycomyces nitens]|nr:ribosomal protein L30, ferredoxin-like fold domain-containing protein [Phycomyces nitens]
MQNVSVAGITCTPNIANPIYVPENLLKKRKINEKKAIENARKRAEVRKQHKKDSKTVFKRVDQFIRTNRDIEREAARLRRQRQKANQRGSVPDENKLLFVLRYKSSPTLHPTVRKTFAKLRLTSLNTGVFVKLNEKTAPMLQTIEPYVSFGEPTLKTVRELLIKRGYAKVNGKRTAISDNAMVEEALGKYNIICLEDMIHEIVTVGEHFDAVNNFIFPFKLSSPVKGWRQRKLKEIMEQAEGVEREEDDINKMVETMN